MPSHGRNRTLRSDIVYRCQRIQWDDRYVVQQQRIPRGSLEARPTAPSVTHHIIAFLVDAPDETEGVWLGATAPGVPASVYPDGAAKKIPKDASLMFEPHYT